MPVLVPVTTAISILGLLWFRSPPSRSASRSAWELVDDWLPLTVLSQQTRVAPREREYGQIGLRPDRRCVPRCRALGQRRPGNGSDLSARRHRLQGGDGDQGRDGCRRDRRVHPGRGDLRRVSASPWVWRRELRTLSAPLLDDEGAARQERL